MNKMKKSILFAVLILFILAVGLRADVFDWFKEAGEKVIKTGEKVGKKVFETGKKVGEEVVKTGKKVGKKIEKETKKTWCKVKFAPEMAKLQADLKSRQVYQQILTVGKGVTKVGGEIGKLANTFLKKSVIMRGAAFDARLGDIAQLKLPKVEIDVEIAGKPVRVSAKPDIKEIAKSLFREINNAFVKGLLK